MPSVVQPGGDGDSGGGAAVRERPSRGRAAQRKPPGCRGTTRARTASSNRREPERVGTKTVPEVKPTRAASSTRRGATPAMAAATRARSASTCRSRATPAMTAAMHARAAASRRRGPPRGGGESQRDTARGEGDPPGRQGDAPHIASGGVADSQVLARREGRESNVAEARLAKSFLLSCHARAAVEPINARRAVGRAPLLPSHRHRRRRPAGVWHASSGEMAGGGIDVRSGGTLRLRGRGARAGWSG